MTQEEKELLLRDISARLSYRGLICQTNKGKGTLISLECSFGEDLVYVDFGYSQAEEFDLNEDDEVKPYLRPMSSMTEEELKEFAYTILQQPDLDAVRNWRTLSIDLEELSKVLDWLNKKMFDYRGLIPMGLALEAPEGMYK